MMKGPRAQTSFLDSARPTKPMVSTNRIRSAIGTEIYLRDLTQASDDQRYEIPCPLLDELKDVQNRCESKENNKDDCSDLRWVVSVQDVGVGVAIMDVLRAGQILFGIVRALEGQCKA